MEQALREKGLYEGQDMKEVISEIDADNVRQTISILSNSIIFFFSYLEESKFK